MLRCVTGDTVGYPAFIVECALFGIVAATSYYRVKDAPFQVCFLSAGSQFGGLLVKRATVFREALKRVAKCAIRRRSIPEDRQIGESTVSWPPASEPGQRHTPGLLNQG